MNQHQGQTQLKKKLIVPFFFIFFIFKNLRVVYHKLLEGNDYQTVTNFPE